MCRDHEDEVNLSTVHQSNHRLKYKKIHIELVRVDYGEDRYFMKYLKLIIIGDTGPYIYSYINHAIHL